MDRSENDQLPTYDSNIDNLFNITYIVSYQQLNNFSQWKSKFEKADVLIINNIKNYNDYTISNLKKILKKDVILIVIPFVRFEGYWLPEQYKKLRFFSGNSVSYFPNVNENNNFIDICTTIISYLPKYDIIKFRNYSYYDYI